MSTLCKILHVSTGASDSIKTITCNHDRLTIERQELLRNTDDSKRLFGIPFVVSGVVAISI